MYGVPDGDLQRPLIKFVQCFTDKTEDVIA